MFNKAFHPEVNSGQVLTDKIYSEYFDWLNMTPVELNKYYKQMKKILTCFLLLIATVIMSCGGDVQNAQVQNITPEQMLDALMEDDIQVLDVRTPKEYKEGRINGSKNICVTSSDFKERAKLLDKNKPVYLYCKSGGRSDKAAKILKEMGFKKIYDMTGGMNEWEEKGLETDKS